MSGIAFLPPATGKASHTVGDVFMSPDLELERGYRVGGTRESAHRSYSALSILPVLGGTPAATRKDSEPKGFGGDRTTYHLTTRAGMRGLLAVVVEPCTGPNE